MFAAKSTLLFAVFAISIRLASAIPPACLLAAVNTQSNPADLPTLCGKDSSKVQEQIRSLCGDKTEAALDAYRNTCKAIGKTIPSESSSSKPSKTASATFKSTSKSKSELTDKSTTEAKASSSTAEGSSSTAEASSSAAEASSSTSVASIPYPSIISSTSVVVPTGYVSATGNAGTTGLVGSSRGLGSGPGSAATGSPILPSATNARGSSATPSEYTGTASKNIGALSAGILAIASIILAL